MLEARLLWNRATGRNGGQLVSNAAENNASWRQALGPEQARQVIQLTFNNVERMQQLVNDVRLKEEAEYRDIQKVRAYFDHDSFNAMLSSVAQLKADCPMVYALYAMLTGAQEVEISSPPSP
ncbi:uncharacterized protein BO97DRAFT_429794 [Aspergillus homomorphus CBS 101889]|uniref:Uncharacterized protein n=1 Tax=Aspergillus homomorphus (strain CBS 101889) TaxID=1450537 RepID=A0A395HGF2_ASPHC|nr:hypothetical protein BO97DRAFT_429794 [Aspergillus homomorphus CBS 101889]RAL06927.1 hypothetical protein BO97DRAFT_429794 [Aspergillus homomorphus CBS 101889]